MSGNAHGSFLTTEQLEELEARTEEAKEQMFGKP
jgi:hypothetical protein